MIYHNFIFFVFFVIDYCRFFFFLLCFYSYFTHLRKHEIYVC